MQTSLSAFLAQQQWPRKREKKTAAAEEATKVDEQEIFCYRDEELLGTGLSRMRTRMDVNCFPARINAQTAALELHFPSARAIVSRRDRARVGAT